MPQDTSYKKSQIAQIIKETSAFFDVVRLVDPISMTVYTIEGDELKAEPDGCYHVWNKEGRCENCISSRCALEHARFSKFEFIDQDIYHVVAQPVNVDGQQFVLEVVTASNDNVLLSAFGNNDFVDRITSFNHKVYTDELTRLSNRRFLNERLPIMIDRAAHDGASLAAIMIDIDDFKGVNDAYGHLKGDEILRLTASHLREGLSPADDCDVVARYGGDEFFAALKGLARDEVESRLQAVLDLASRNDLGITVSIGAYFLPKAGYMDAEALIKRADRVMYRIKTSGKNNYAIEG